MPFVLLKDPYRWRKIGYRLRERFGRIFRHTIFTAIESGADEEALRLGSQRVLMRARDEWGRSPLVAAINKCRPMLVHEFIRRGGMRPGDGSLAHASIAGDIAAVRMLLAANKVRWYVPSSRTRCLRKTLRWNQNSGNINFALPGRH